MMKIIKNRSKKAFTMIELVFVIVIMGVLAKFGVEFLFQAYGNFINSKINNELQSNSATATEFVAARLQYRIKTSTIAREDNDSFEPIRDYFNATANIIEWIGYDVEGYRGDINGTWSGVIDLNSSETNASQITSIGTDTSRVNSYVLALSDGNATIDDTAIYFVDPDALEDNASRWGWDMSLNQSVFDDQSLVYIHPTKAHPTNSSIFLPANKMDGSDNNFSGVKAFEYYQLAWTAYAVGIPDYNTTAMGGNNTGNLTLWYNYQPWQGENYKDHGTPITIMQNVSSFQFRARESIMKIQVCVKSVLLKDTDGDYSICKEKTIF